MFSLSRRTTGKTSFSFYQIKAKPYRNAEEMLNEEGKPKTSHTTNKVPFVMASAPNSWSLRSEGGVLGDVAPTVLDAMGIEKPNEMSGSSLLIKT